MQLHEGDSGRLYTGEYDAEGPLKWHALVTDGNGQRSLEEHTRASGWVHSPDGHSWGYGGSGPTQLALDLLWDVTGREPSPDMLIRIRQQYIELFDRHAGWQLTEAEVEAWIEQYQAETRPS